MKLSFRSLVQYLVLFALGVVILYFAFRDQNIAAIWQEIKAANLFWVTVSALCVIAAHILRALRWQMLFKSINYNIRLSHLYHGVMIGYLTNLIIPRLGEVTRCTVTKKTDNIPIYASIGTVVTERLFDTIILLLSGILLLVLQYNLVFSFIYKTIIINLLKIFSQLNYFWLIFTIIALLIAFFIGAYIIKRKLNRSFLKILAGLKQGFLSYHKLKQKALFIGYSLTIWFLYYLSMYLAFFAIAQTSILDFNAAFTALVFSGFAMAAPVQGGIGVFHWMVAQSLLLYGIRFNDGLAYATIIHSCQFLITIILGFTSLIIVLIKSLKK